MTGLDALPTRTLATWTRMAANTVAAAREHLDMAADSVHVTFWSAELADALETQRQLRTEASRRRAARDLTATGAITATGDAA